MSGAEENSGGKMETTLLEQQFKTCDKKNKNKQKKKLNNGNKISMQLKNKRKKSFQM